MTTSTTLELPVPEFFVSKTRPRIADLWWPDYEDVAKKALAWKKEYSIQSPAQDKMKIALVGIDQQLTFIHPKAQLPVAGAMDDSIRFCEFLYRNLAQITQVVATMDTHTVWQIFHEVFLIDADGNHPAPGTLIPDADIQAGKWRVAPEAAYAVFGNANKYPALMQYLGHYSKELVNSNGKYPLITWPFHAMLGGIDHALLPAIHEAMFFHSIARGRRTQFEIKGGQPLSEAYSPYGEEVTTDHNGKSVGQKNTAMFELLSKFDAVIITGQAKSHCLRAFVADHLAFVEATDPALAKKCYLVEDLTSPVVLVPGDAHLDFTKSANDAFEDFAAKGMNVVQSTTPMCQWPGLERLAD